MKTRANSVTHVLQPSDFIEVSALIHALQKTPTVQDAGIVCAEVYKIVDKLTLQAYKLGVKEAND